MLNYSHCTYVIIFFAAFREMEATRLKFLGGFGKLRKVAISVVLSARNCPAPTGGIFGKFVISVGL